MATFPPLLHPVALRQVGFSLCFDGAEVAAQPGETVISALLRAGLMTGCSEFDGGARCGFCLMGACQDCTLWTASGQRLRACMAEVAPGMVLLSRPPLAAAVVP